MGHAGAVGETRYARSGDVHVAYRIVGSGPPDTVLVADWFGNVELMWDDLALAHVLDRLASFSRLIVFDKRGVGLSDPVESSGLPTLEAWMADVGAVMDDVGSDQAVVVGVGAGGPMVMQFAASHPERVSALVLVNTYARLRRADDYPAGVPDPVRDQILEVPYVDERTVDTLAGASGDVARRRWWTRYQRQSVSPGTAAAMRSMMFEVDVRGVLGSIQASTLVLQRRDDPWIRIGHAHHLAAHIPGARLVVLPGDEDLFFLGDVDTLLDEVEQHVTGTPPSPRSDRALATVLFTDLVDSTAMAARLGDRRWSRLLDEHDAVVARALARHRGRKVNPTGDGVLVVFDGPGRAIRCGGAIRDELVGLGFEVRAGVHTGEVEVRGDDVGGIAVNIGARIAALAGAGEVLVSSTVRDLVAGSGIAFRDCGEHLLKGVPDPWRVFAVTD